ncbi:MAG: hypothetical protein FJ314_02820 [SAR202 cluster bacterium]|nr:hypothetical protein [SAR202 cluster bacterium]
MKTMSADGDRLFSTTLRPGYVSPAIALDARLVGQEEWGLLVLLGAVAFATLAYVGYCTFSGGGSSFSLSLSGVSGTCN